VAGVESLTVQRLHDAQRGRAPGTSDRLTSPRNWEKKVLVSPWFLLIKFQKVITLLRVNSIAWKRCEEIFVDNQKLISTI
jgi:hypothetical protein